MARPRLIIIIRHAQSEGNKSREVHQTIPDHRIKLTALGRRQALDAGRRLRALLLPTDTLQFYTSPYYRTRETTEGILTSLTSPGDDGLPSPFDRRRIKVYEEPRIREQDFGNFQPCTAEVERMWQERADYGHFLYRIPNGESAADAYDRISGFNESLWRQFGEDSFPSVCVLVTHGLMSRVFLMKWYHFSVEYFEDLRNIDHCEFLIMQRNDETCKYILQNKLRTWSDLRRERAEKTAGKADKPKNHTTTTRRWGGCPNGCDHGTGYKRRDDLEMLRRIDLESETTEIPSAKQPHPDRPVTPTPSALPLTVRRRQQAASLTMPVATSHIHDDAADKLASGSERPVSAVTDSVADSDLLLTDATDQASNGKSGSGSDFAPDSAPAPLVPMPGPEAEATALTTTPYAATLASASVSTPDTAPLVSTLAGRGTRARAIAAVTALPSPSPLLLKSPPFFRLGRDFGGSDSGAGSVANSDTDLSDDDRRLQGLASALALSSGMGRGAQANKLGDAPQGSDGDDEEGDEDEDEDYAARAKESECSIQASVF